MGALVSVEILRTVCPRCPEATRAVFAGLLNATMPKWEIDTPTRAAAFLAQAAHESAEFTHLEENLNYSAERLLAVWPSRFNAFEAAGYQRDPQRIASRVYANRLGNGDEASGDGWTYRGRGVFGLTGKSNYRDASIAIAGDADTLLVNPDLVATPEYACETAGWFWHDMHLNVYADAGTFDALTRRINGGLHGLDSRTVYWRRAIAALA